MSRFIYCYAKCHYGARRYAECRYAECRYAECHGAIKTCAWIQHLLARKHQTRMELSVYYDGETLYNTGPWVKPKLKVKQLQKTIHVLRRL